MIGYIQGKVIHSDEGVVLLENNGIGYEIVCSGALYAKLLTDGQGEAYTYLQVRDDCLTLFGFASLEEKKMFLQLVSVSGVGAKMGIAVLSAMNVGDIAVAIASSDVRRLTSVKGLGKKTAERIVLELREKVSAQPAERDRAAGKAAFAGKQTAIMVPTTLLAQQHYESFSARFADTGVRVETVSRFVPPARQRKILTDLADGKVDIIIGTHRLLTDDVKFKDLGLVIVDEEHRFGVMHKDHMKKAFPGVDMLMLSATPIPRSLSLSMSGLRDMSVLQTPPQRRLPVITVVRPFSEELLKNAVLREKNRGGQIFFVHNRISDIEERAVMLKRLFPKLKITVAHSKTPEAALEKIMSEFAAGVTDILVCTTIVESGLDIPAANTLIVDDAQELGLAQMYQLRGRVGRREDQAYAFLFYPNDVHISVESSERLEAIAELDELGAGYQLAQRDLQIRGGGDLVGISQHGNSTKIGYQRYCDLLAEEIAKIKGTYRPQIELEVGFPVSIPASYLPQENLRVTLYRRMLKAESDGEVRALREETADRFGKLPPEVEFLFDAAAVRNAAYRYGITKVLAGRYELIVFCTPDENWEKLALPQRWRKRADGLIGPGGFAGMREMAQMLCRRDAAAQ